MIRTSSETAQFDEAFAKAQAKFEAAAKSSANPAFRSKYADISSVIEATLEHLNSEGIGVQQHPALELKGEQAYITVTTRLTFKGQWVESDFSVPATQRERFDPQSCGSGVTYACRYPLQSIFCVRRADDDGNAACDIGSKEQAKAVGDKKVEELKAKFNWKDAKGNANYVPMLFWCKTKSGYYIQGDKSLTKLNKDLLERYYDEAENVILVKTDDEFFALRDSREHRKTPFQEMQK